MEKKLKKSTDRITMPAEVKNNIMEQCMNKARNDKHPNEAEQVFGVERVQSRPIIRIVSGIAACAVIAGAIGAATHFMNRSGLPDQQFAAPVTDEVTSTAEETTAAAEEVTEAVSESAAGVNLPDVKAMAQDLAAEQLAEYGLGVDRVYVTSPKVPKGYVTHTFPEAGEVMQKGDVVTLYISSGESEALNVDFAIPSTPKQLEYDRNPDCPLVLTDEQCESIVSEIKTQVYEEVPQEEILAKINNVTPEEQLGFGSYTISWNDQEETYSWGELAVYDIGIVKYEIERMNGENELKYYRIEPARIDTAIRDILGWSVGYCPFGTPYKMGLSYNGEYLTGTRLRAVSNAFFGWNWIDAHVVDSYLSDTPAYEFTSGETVIRVYEDGTIEWIHAKGDPSDSIYRVDNVDGDQPESHCTPICQTIEEALNS